MSRSDTTGAGAITGWSTSRTVTSMGRLTSASTARSPVTALAFRFEPHRTHRMARSVATAIQEGNRKGARSLDGSRRWDYAARPMLESGGRARLLQVIIWLATLFFAAMLFAPLLREAVRRMTELPSGGHF